MPGRRRREPARDLAVDRPDRAVRQGHFIRNIEAPAFARAPCRRGSSSWLAAHGLFRIIALKEANRQDGTGGHARARNQSGTSSAGEPQRLAYQAFARIYHARFQQKSPTNPKGRRASKCRGDARIVAVIARNLLSRKRRRRPRPRFPVQPLPVAPPCIISTLRRVRPRAGNFSSSAICQTRRTQAGLSSKRPKKCRRRYQ